MKSSEKNKNQFSLLLNQKISFNGTTKYQIKKKKNVFQTSYNELKFFFEKQNILYFSLKNIVSKHYIVSYRVVRLISPFNYLDKLDTVWSSNRKKEKNEQKTVVVVKNEKNLQVVRTVALNCFAAKEDGRLE